MEDDFNPERVDQADVIVVKEVKSLLPIEDLLQLIGSKRRRVTVLNIDPATGIGTVVPRFAFADEVTDLKSRLDSLLTVTGRLAAATDVASLSGRVNVLFWLLGGGFAGFLLRDPIASLLRRARKAPDREEAA